MLAERRRGIPLILLSSCFFAVMALCVRALSRELPVAEILRFRFGIGLCAMLAWFLVRRRAPRIPRPGVWILRGVLGGGAVFLYYHSLSALPVGPATLLTYMAPVWAAIFGILFLREQVSWTQAGGLSLATFGAVVVALESSKDVDLGALWPGSAALAGLLSAVLSGAAMTSVRSLRRDTDAPTVFLSFSLFGLLWAVPFASAKGPPLSSTALWLAIAIGVLSAVGQLIFTVAFKYVSAARGSAATQVTPALSWLLGVLVLHEPLQPRALVGAAVCMAGIVWGTGVLARAGPPVETAPGFFRSGH